MHRPKPQTRPLVFQVVSYSRNSQIRFSTEELARLQRLRGDSATATQGRTDAARGLGLGRDLGG